MIGKIMQQSKSSTALAVAKILVISYAGNGRYNCPRIKNHNYDHHNAALNIKNDGTYHCSCGLQGDNPEGLAVSLYGSAARAWFRNKIES
jgi:hypothetical protein